MLSVSLLLAAFASLSPVQAAAVQKRDLFGCFEQNCSTPTIDFPLPAGAPIPDASTIGNLTYDYIIVGAGTTGATVASRLSENPAIRVAVIGESGAAYFDFQELFVDRSLILQRPAPTTLTVPFQMLSW